MRGCKFKSKLSHRRGAAAVLAMMFLVIFTTLSVAMYSLSASNVQSARNLADVERARLSAESGLRWMQYRLAKMSRPKTTSGTITATVANTLWPSIVTAIQTDFASLLTPAERTLTVSGTTVTSGNISVEGTGGATFKLVIQQHPLAVGDPLDQRYVRVTSTGAYGQTVRSVAMDFKIDKKVRFAVVGKVPIQVGRNTIIEGPVAMGTANKFPPYLGLSDFTHFDNTLKSRIQAFQNFLESGSFGYDGRIDVFNPVEYQAASNAGYQDYNTDNYIDEFDLFLQRFDTNNDKAISRSEFTNPSTSQLYDANLFTAIDQLGGPLFSGDSTRAGYQDNILDTRDGYAKVEGQIIIAASQSAWSSNLSGSGNSVNDMIQGPITTTELGQTPVKFQASASDIFDLDPVNFEVCANNYKAATGSAAGSSTRTATLIANTTLTAVDANGGMAQERTPFGSTSYQATYRRPVFRNYTLRNVIIPKGLNALFDNCVFEGITFVDGLRDITNSSGSVSTNKDDGMNWAQRKISGDSFTKDKVLLSSGTPSSGQTITQGSKYGNNLRFNNCTFKGPIAGSYATAYTHFANSWEFTGATLFNNVVDQTATIVSPQVNIEMGSFTDPAAAPSTLVGVVVAGNIDVRGTSNVDGSLIITGDGAGNTTLGYFGSSDGDTNPSAMPEGGYGRLNIRYNPFRALPDGINVAVDILPDVSTYKEGT